MSNPFILIISSTKSTQIQNFNVQFEPQISKDVYIDKVNALKELIQRGDIYEINFCKEYLAKNIEEEDVKNCYTNLNSITKAPFSSYFRFGEFEIFCGSPERFIKNDAGTLTSEPIKGTSKRGETSKEDKQLIHSLKRDPKETAENILIVDLMRNDLSKIAKILNLERCKGIQIL